MADPTNPYQLAVAAMRTLISRQPTSFAAVVTINCTVPGYPGKLIGTMTREEGPLGRWWYYASLQGVKASFWVFNTHQLGYTWAMPLVRSVTRRGPDLYIEDWAATLRQLGQPYKDERVRAGTGRRATWRDRADNLLTAFAPIAIQHLSRAK